MRACPSAGFVNSRALQASEKVSRQGSNQKSLRAESVLRVTGICKYRAKDGESRKIDFFHVLSILVEPDLV